MRLNDRQTVTRQYQNDANLSKRIKLHVKHSTSPIAFWDWCFTQYHFHENDRILELGCGNGAQWRGHTDRLPAGAVLVLSDVSAGMVETAWRANAAHPRILAQQLDIQAIPYPAASFDCVIANHMLYHVPDLPAALAQVRRVLRPDGVFYCTTNGEYDMRGYLHDALLRFRPSLNVFAEELSFTLQNGAAQLRRYFADVQLAVFADSLRVTETQDLIDWIESSPSMQDVAPEALAGLYDWFEAIRIREGAILIPKEAGMFTARGYVGEA